MVNTIVTRRAIGRRRILGSAAALLVLAVGALVPVAADAAPCNWPAYGGPCAGQAAGNVGNRKYMDTTAYLYRNGYVHVDSWGRVTHPFEGLRGRVRLVAHDAQGNMIWVSREFENPTLCGTWDPTCASARMTNHE